MRVEYLGIAALLTASVLPVPALAQASAPKADESDHQPSETMPALKQVEALERAGKLKEAEAALAQIRNANPTRIEPLIFIGQRFYNSAPAKARPWFEQALSIDAANPYPQAYLARLDAKAGQVDAARARLNAADKKKAGSLELRLARADVEMAANNPTGALPSLRAAKAMGLSKEARLEVLVRLADVYMALKRWGEAEAELDTILAAVKHPVRLVQRGDARLHQNRTAEAIADYQAAAATEYGRSPQIAPQIASRIATAKNAGSVVLTIDSTNFSKYYAFVTTEEFVRTEKAGVGYICRPGQLVYASAEVRQQPDPLGMNPLSVVPVRKVGSAGAVGTVTLVYDEQKPYSPPMLWTVDVKDSADARALSTRRQVKMCPPR